MLNRDSAVLVVIDFQEKLLPKIPVADALIPSAVRLIRFARELGLPILWTEQYPKGLGPTVDAIAGRLAGNTAMAKTSFGCFGDPGFRHALSDTGRTQLLVTGIETHVCVMQTVLAALDHRCEVFVPRDAVASRAKADYNAGLARMERAGAQLVTSEMAMFEILREAGTPEFKRVLPLIK
jgi:nicotinamidase-related amidase